jgi:hypothetical protein
MACSGIRETACPSFRREENRTSTAAVRAMIDHACHTSRATGYPTLRRVVPCYVLFSLLLVTHVNTDSTVSAALFQREEKMTLSGYVSPSGCAKCISTFIEYFEAIDTDYCSIKVYIFAEREIEASNFIKKIRKRVPCAFMPESMLRAQGVRENGWVTLTRGGKTLAEGVLLERGVPERISNEIRKQVKRAMKNTGGKTMQRER